MVFYTDFVFEDASIQNYKRCLFSGLPKLSRLMEFGLRWRLYGFSIWFKVDLSCV